MKRIIGILALVACVAAFTTSCNKKCTCKTYADGAVLRTYEQEIDKGQKCSDYTNILIEDPKTGLECK